MESSLQTIEEFDLQGVASTFHFIGAAGFEERAVRGLGSLKNLRIPVESICLLDFRQGRVAENSENLKLMMEWSVELGLEPVVGQIDRVEEVLCQFLEASISDRSRILLDISGMPHATELRCLRTLKRLGQSPIVLYTEAESYYPRREDASYLEIVEGEIDYEEAFDQASRMENEEVMFAGLANVGTVKGYEGRLSPFEPTTVVVFPTFKRLRTAAILAEIEVNRKVFILGEPVRSDLSWRRDALRVINFDLMDSDTDDIYDVSTLDPVETYSILREVVRSGPLFGNLIVCPHGSKMQTVGVWRFCEMFPGVRVVLSTPREFFPAKYSNGSGNTFLFDTLAFLEEC